MKKKVFGNRILKVLIVIITIVCIFTSCDLLGNKKDKESAHTHRFSVKANGQLKCTGCSEHIDNNYIAVVDAYDSVQSFARLTGSNSSLGLSVDGSNVSYTNTGSNAKKIVIYTTSNQNLTINAPNDDITHFGKVKSVNIIAVADNSYHGKATVEESITVAKGNIELEVSVPEVKVEATGNVSINLGQDVQVESLSVETKEWSALQTVNVGGTGSVEKLETTTPVKIETKVEALEVKSENVSITLSGNADITEVKVDETLNFTSTNKFEINIEGEAKVEGVTGVDSEALETKTEPGATPAHIHTWDKGQVTTPATCITDGVLTKSCTDTSCHETSTVVIKALGHDIEHYNAKAPTCTEVGWDAYDICKREGCTYTTKKEIKAIGHNYGEPVWTWSNDNSTASAKFTCANDAQHIETVKASVSSKVTLAPTCTEDGSNELTAEVTFNGTTYTDKKTVTLTKLGHDIEHHEAKVPTCEEKGWGAYDTCKREGCNYTTKKEIQPIGHNYGEPEWTWSEDCSTALAKFTCANDSKHVETVNSSVSSVVILQPTCTEKGNTKYTAVVSFGGNTYTTEKNAEIAALGHDLVHHDAKAPTCAEVGWDAYDTCKREGCTYTTKVEKKAIGHSYGEPVWTWSEDNSTATAKFTCANDSKHVETVNAGVSSKETLAPTCTEKGNAKYTALVYFNGKTYSEEKLVETKAWDHDLEHYDAKAPTCTEVGWDAYDACKREGCTYTTYLEKKALGHDYKETVTPPTSTSEGYTTYECSRCHDTYRDNYVPALGHTFGSPVWEWNNDNSTAIAKFTCTTETGHVENKEANITVNVVKAATCTEDGSNELTAEVTFNGTKYTDKKTVIVPKLGHDIEHHDAKAPTCTDVGWDAYDTCKREGCTYTTKVEKKAIGHSYGEPVWTWSEDNSTATAKFTCANDSKHVETVNAGVSSKETLAPTCTEKGNAKYTALVYFNGKTYSEEKLVETKAWDHDLEHYDAKAPTCTEVGWDAYDACKREGCTYTTKKEIKAIGHNYGEPEWTWSEDNSTATAKFTCTNNSSHVETVNAGVSSVVTLQPTCTEKGNTKYTAVVSFGGKTYTTEKNVEIASLGHDLEHHNAKAPTCTEVGWDAYDTCKREGCDYSTYIEISETGHNYNSSDVCINCGQHKPQDILPGIFTVSISGDKVNFSRGNLWYNTSTDTWNLEDSQLDYQTSWDANHVDKFYWSKDASVAVAQSYSESSASTSDKFFAVENFSVNGYNKWGTLSDKEWEYLLFTRSTNVTEVGTSNARYARVIVDGVRGLILFPDTMTWETSLMGSIPAYINDYNSNINEDWSKATSYTREQFKKQEEAGIAFLPCSGWRSGPSVMSSGSNGDYWTSTTSSWIIDNTGFLAFGDSCVDNPSTTYINRFYGHTVRLVTWVHRHGFDREKVDTKFFKSAATCTEGAVYYKSCECGEKGTETFVYGEPLGHNYGSDGVCTECEHSMFLTGTFTINSTDKVQFSSGNLWYNISTGVWNIENSQLDYQTSWNANHVDKFYWSKDVSVAVAQEYIDTSVSTSDKFFAAENFSVNGYNKWGTLSGKEWNYLLFTRSTNVTEVGTSNARYARVIVDGVRGLILFPDTMTWETSLMGSIPAYINDYNSNINEDWSKATSYTREQFKKQEEAGIAFLPCAGYRIGPSFDDVGSYGDYCASMPNSSDAYFTSTNSMYFNYNNVGADTFSGSRYCGEAVRLVTRVENYIPQHAHEYNLEVADYRYLKSEATCTEKAVYYKSCECGKASKTKTFVYGSPLGHSYNIQGVCIHCGREKPQDVLPGVFKVDSNGNVVQFARGNLWYNTGASTWNFEEDQYTPGQTSWDENHVDKFFWSKDAAIAVAQNYNDPNVSTTDKFFASDNFSVNGYDKWETLSKDEWNYLLFTRTTNVIGIGEVTNARFARVKVNGVQGLLLFPDEFAWDITTMGDLPSFINDADSISDWSLATRFTTSQFEKQEENGIVFLPCAGCRYDSSFNYVGFYGNYWSSTPDASYSGMAGNMEYYYVVHVYSDYDRIEGMSVRLVTRAEENDNPQHTHKYDQEIVDSKYLKSEATCTESAVYYKSCECGEIGTETFVYGSPLGHNYNSQGICIACGHKKTQDILPGVFTIDSSGNGVQFARGNLWYNTSTGSWSLEDSQLNYQTSWDANHVDKFYWSKDASVAVAEEYSDSNTSYHDKFFAAENFTVDGYAKWSTLGYDEWYYLLFARNTNVTGVETSNARFARVIENGVKGLLLFPDTFAWNTSTMGANPALINSDEYVVSDDGIGCTWSEATSYTPDQFEKQEEAGIVFLPCAGCRYGSSFSFVVGLSGRYWTSSTDFGNSSSVDFVGFNESNVETYICGDRYCGNTVRLVARVENDNPQHTHSEGLVYKLSSYKTYYILTGIGACKDTEIVIPEVYNNLPVKEIENYTFDNCAGITSITIPSSVTRIGYSAFCDCTGLTSITIPSSVTSIRERAFDGCTSLARITVDKDNPYYYSEGNCLIDKTTKEVLLGCNTSVLPSNVISIGDHAFYGCTGLSEISIPNSVTSIGNYAFEGCRGLTSMTIPTSVTNIGDYAFYGCTGLTKIDIHKSHGSISGGVWEPSNVMVNWLGED